MIWVEAALADWLGDGASALRRAFALDGEVYREPSGARRRTLRVEHAGRGYFVKLHWGVGWREIFKNLLVLKRPVLGARNEWQAIQRLDELGVETMQLVAYGETGWNPARLKSFVMTRELESTISLEDYCRDWPVSPPPLGEKRALIRRVARMAATLHANGLNHRDLYICHFLLRQPWDGRDATLHLHLIDLHRVQIRAATPLRWRIRDLAALYFSAMDIGLSERDLLRFIHHYTRAPLADGLRAQRALWRAVQARAARLYRHRPVEREAVGDA